MADHRLEIILAAKDMSQKAFDGFLGRIKRITSSIFSFHGAVATLAGTSGLGLLVNRSLETADAIGKTADKLGLSTRALQEYRFAAEQSGIAQNTLDMALQRFTRRTAEAYQGMGELKGVLEQYNIGLKNADGSMRSSEAIFADLADVIAGTENSSERLRIAFKAFDSEGAALVNMLRRGSAGLDAFSAEARDLGLVIDEKLIRNAEKASDQLNVVSKIISANLTSAVLELAPAITGVAADIAEWTKANRELISVKIDEYAEKVQTVATGIKNLTADIVSGWQAMPDVVQEVGIVGAVVGGKKGLAILLGATIMVNWADRLGKGLGLAAEGVIGFKDVIFSTKSELEALIQAFEDAEGAASRFAERGEQRFGLSAYKITGGPEKKDTTDELEGTKQIFKDIENAGFDDWLDRSTGSWKKLGGEIKTVNDLLLDLTGIKWDKTERTFDRLFDHITPINEALESLGAEIQNIPDKLSFADDLMELLDPDFFQELAKATEEQTDRTKDLTAAFGATSTVLENMGDMFAKDKTEMNAFHKAAVAMAQVEAIHNAVVAISNQGKGDPYTAFGRIAAMSSVMAGVLGIIGLSTGGAGGGSRISPEPIKGTALGEKGVNLGVSDSLDVLKDQTDVLRDIRKEMEALNKNLTSPAANVFRFLAEAKAYGFKYPDYMAGRTVGAIADWNYQGTGEGLDILREYVFTSLQDTFNVMLDLTEELGLSTTKLRSAILSGFDLELLDVRNMTAGELSEFMQGWISANTNQVLSDAFDGFIGTYQTAGEDMIETLTRLTVDMRTVEQSIRSTGRLGFELTGASGVRFAETFVDLAGDLDDFAEAAEKFADKFVPGAVEFNLIAEDISKVLSTIPGTREGLYSLVRGLDLLDETDRRLYISILELSDAFDDYYQNLERRSSIYDSINAYMADLRGTSTELGKELAAMAEYFEDQIAALRELGDAETKLAGIRADQAEATQIIIEQYADSIIDTYNDLQRQWTDFVSGLSTSNLAPVQSAGAMDAAYAAKLAAAASGDSAALQSLFSFVQGEYLPFYQAYAGGGADYKDIYNSVLDQIRGMNLEISRNIGDIPSALKAALIEALADAEIQATLGDGTINITLMLGEKIIGDALSVSLDSNENVVLKMG